MATVRMSDKLKVDIRSEAKRQFKKVNPKQEFSLELGDRIYNKYIAPLTPKIKKLDKEANLKGYFGFTKSSELDIGIETKGGEISDYLNIPMSAEREIPGSSGYGSSAARLNLKANSPEAKEIRKILNFNEDIGNKKHEYTSLVADNLDNFTTLNQALKAWPALEKLITDNWAMQRVHERVKRKKKQDEQRAEIELNETELNSVILTNSLLGDD